MGDNDRLQSMCNELIQFFNFTGRWDECLWLFEQAEKYSFAAGNKGRAGWRAYEAGRIYHLRNQPTEVLACAERATEHWKDSTQRNKAWAIQLRGLGYHLNEDYSAAITAYREVVEIFRSISAKSDDVSIALNSLASAEHANKDYAAAERDCREALRIAKKTNYQEGVAYMTGNLAALALDRAELAEDEAPVLSDIVLLKEAEGLAREALALAEKVGRLELIAGDCHRLAQALLKQNLVLSGAEGKNLDEALSLSHHAVEIFMRLRSPNLQSAQETLAEIEAKIQENGE